MYSKINSLAELPANEFGKTDFKDYFEAEGSFAKYKLQDNDGTLIGACGFYRSTVLSQFVVVWFMRTAALKPIHLRSLLKAFDIVRNGPDKLIAQVDKTDARALRFVQRMGAEEIQEGIFAWPI